MFLVRISDKLYIDAGKISKISIDRYINLSVGGLDFEVASDFEESFLQAMNGYNSDLSPVLLSKGSK